VNKCAPQDYHRKLPEEKSSKKYFLQGLWLYGFIWVNEGRMATATSLFLL
jgi:hypothetical protein